VFLKTKQRDGRTNFFLCIAERGGNNRGSERGGKEIEYSVCLGDTLDLSAEQWFEILGKSSNFRSVALTDVLKVVERYATAHGLRFDTFAGLREAASATKRTGSKACSERRSQGDERIAALRVLGLAPGASEQQIELAFRKEARRHHPDVGGDPLRFRSIVRARDFLLGRDPRAGGSA
jgi:DnaJ domain